MRSWFPQHPEGAPDVRCEVLTSCEIKNRHDLQVAAGRGLQKGPKSQEKEDHQAEAFTGEPQDMHQGGINTGEQPSGKRETRDKLSGKVMGERLGQSLYSLPL